MVSITERAKAFFREHPVTTERKVNQYLTEHIPRLAREYKLATTKDCLTVDNRMDKYEEDLDGLEEWRSDTKVKVEDLKKRVSKLEIKHG